MPDESPSYWWQAPQGNAHTAVWQTIDKICQQQMQQREDMAQYLEMYANGNVSGIGLSAEPGSQRARNYWYRRGDQAAPRFNLSAAIVDTVTSMVAYQPPIPQYLTNGAEYWTIRKAKKKTRVLQGQMHHLAEPLMRRGFMDACKTGTGLVWGSIGEDGLPQLRRVSSLELLVEHCDGLYMAPRSIHRLETCVSKEWLVGQHPKFETQINSASVNSKRAIMLRFLPTLWGQGGMCEVAESIHLPTGTRPGRRTLCISNATLEEEEWDSDEFPLAVCRYRERDFGFYGSGLIEAAFESQLRVDDLCERNARSQNLGSTLKIFNRNGEGTLKKSEISNELGTVYDVNGAQPLDVVTFSGTLEDLQEQIDIEMQRLLFVEGVSASQAAGDGASQGLTSGVAIRAEEDTRASRMVRPIEMYQKFCLSSAKLIERLNDRVAARNPKYVPKGRIKNGRETFLINTTWKELELPSSGADPEIEMFPMSSLPNSPSGRYAAVMEWIQGGFTDRQYGMQLLGFPDIDAYADVQLAYIDLVQWQIEQIVDKDKRTLPIPRQDHGIAIDLGQRALARLWCMENVPSTVLENMDFYIRKAEELQEKAGLELARKQAKQQMAAQPPQQPVQGAGGDPNALSGAAPAQPGAGPRLVA